MVDCELAEGGKNLWGGAAEATGVSTGRTPPVGGGIRGGSDWGGGLTICFRSQAVTGGLRGGVLGGSF